MWMNIANALTISRIGLIPVFFILVYFNQQAISFLCLVFLLLTDFFDGKVARKFNQTTDFGSILDPVADKITTLVFFPYLYSQGMVPLWFLFIVIFRECAQLMSIPILKGYLGISFKVKPSLIAKYTTALNFFLIAFMIAFKLPTLNYIFMAISGMLQIYITATYIPRFIQIARRQHDTFE
ncbi:MAG: CDP-alcohol phosphatidyltransferase family protein [Deltaproteobacteria bacterium]|nr:CDP-alcohol phosphatidyltransferase family protein [Deltaproteobacteria bacterium]